MAIQLECITDNKKKRKAGTFLASFFCEILFFI